jgi:ABC-type sulfate/molybdate transport systems ATPase subunit
MANGNSETEITKNNKGLSTLEVWLLDEPFTALDPQGVKIIEHCISKHGKQGGLCLFTTHQDSALKHQKVLETNNPAKITRRFCPAESLPQYSSS